MKLNFLDRFSKNAEISNLIKIHPVGSNLLYEDGQTHRQTDGRTDTQTDGRTDVTKLTVVFCNSANAPNNKLLISDVPNLCVIYSSDE